MAGEPLSAPSRADSTERAFALTHAREHLERLGYRLLEEHAIAARARACWSRSRSAGASSSSASCASSGPVRRSGRGTARDRSGCAAQGSPGWRPALGSNAHTVRFDPLTVFVGQDGIPVGLENEPQAF
jgi:hypothetical protein